MKRFFALLLCAAMLSAFAVPVAAADNSTYPVSGIDDRAYLADEDSSSRVDMSSSVNRVPYGETVYFPLLSDGSGALAALKKDADEAETAYDKALTKRDQLKSDLATKETEVTKANTKFEDAKKAYEKALGETSGESKEDLEQKMNNAEAEWKKAETTLKNTPVVTQSQVDEAQNNALEAARILGDAQALYQNISKTKEAYDAISLDSGYAEQKEAARLLWVAAQDAWDLAKRQNPSWVGATDEEKLAGLKSNASTTQREYEKLKENLGTYNRAVQKEKDTKQAYDTAADKYHNYTEPTAPKELKEKRDEAQKALNKVIGERDKIKNTDLPAAENDLKSKEAASKKATEAYNSAKKNRFPYVHESSAVEKAKVKVKWEENGNYAGSPSLVRRKVADESYIPGVSSGSNFIYFIAVPIKSRSTTDSRDLFGRVTLSRTGSDRFEYDLDIAIEIGYKDAEDVGSDEGTIMIKKQTFRRNDFDSDSEVTLYFEADSSSKIVFSGRSALPSSIVLGLDTDPDDRLSDKIYKEYGVDVDFFNGNYATFNNTGTLYLAPTDGEDDYYVYSISDDGDIARVSADWDDSEEAYAVRTRTLGRYFLSPQRLSNSFLSKLNGTSSGSSSRPSGSGSGSSSSGSGDLVVIPAPSSPSTTTSTPTYNPPPSTSQPAPSSSQPASSSSSEESSEPEDEDDDEETSEPEDEETSEPEDVVDVDTETDDGEGPEKGGSMLVWILIIVGLVAAGGAIGFVIYQNKVKRDDGYSEYDEYNDDDFPDDDSRD